MDASQIPPGHTPEGGVLVGSPAARHRLVLFEDPQCPFCQKFEAASGDLLLREIAAGAVAVEYRLRSFLGPESVRAANALAAAAGAGKFDELRRVIFANQPPEHSDGFQAEGLLELGECVGLTSDDYVLTVREGRYEDWVREIEAVFAEQDPDGTPAGLLEGQPVDSSVLYDPEALGPLIRA
jgi:predicted DsbA family dithiol-disulfide isomerase